MLRTTRAAAAATVQALLVALGALAAALAATSAAAIDEPASPDAHASSSGNSCRSDDTAWEGNAADATECKQSTAKATLQETSTWAQQQCQQQQDDNCSMSEQPQPFSEPASSTPAANQLTYVVTPGSSFPRDNPCDARSARCSFDARSTRVSFDASSARGSFDTRSSFDFLRRKSMDARSTRSSIDCSSAAANALVGPGWSRVLSFTNSSSGSDDGCSDDAVQQQQEEESVKLGEQQQLL
jgi:hypothetical protein